MLLQPRALVPFTFPKRSFATALDLPTTNLLAWWYAGDGSAVDPTITGSDGNPVTAWADKSGNGHNLAKAGAGTITYRQASSSLNNRGAAQFDGSSYLWKAHSGILGNLTVYTFYAVISLTSTGINCFFGEGRSSSNTPFTRGVIGLGGVAGQAAISHRSDANVNATASGGTGEANTGNATLITGRRVASNDFRSRINGTQWAVNTNAPGTTTLDRLAIGTLLRAATLDLYTGLIATIALYAEDNFTTIEPLLKSHYGIP